MNPAQPEVQALAVCGDRIVAAGTDAEIAPLAGPGTRRVDLGGGFVTPGFHDAHTHQLQTGLARSGLDLSGTGSLAEFQQRVREYAATLAEGEWILGACWDHTLWPGQEFPTRHDLDACTGGRPAYLRRLDVHAAVANTAALRAAGVTRSTEPPPGGRIGREADGEPDGMFFEDAQRLIACHLPPLSPAQRRRALTLAMREALRCGITSVQDYSGWETLLAYEQMRSAGELAIRVTEWLNFKEPLPTLIAQRAHCRPEDPWLRTGLLKAFLDGSLGSRTAALLAPYSDDPDSRGLPQYEPAELHAMAVERVRAGFQLGFHAIGDLAARMALDAFAAAAAAAPQARKRHRIEHLQVLAPEDVPRLRELGVVASVQPSHLLDDARWAQDRLGSQRLACAYPWGSLLRQGVPLALGSDCPVASMDPRVGIYAAVARTSLDGKQLIPPMAEAISLEEALAAYTWGGAYAAFQEKELGSLMPDRFADFVVFAGDLRNIPPAAYLDATILSTVVGGRIMYAAPGWEK